MVKRLVKIAKELNVGTATIVEHLISSGFDIENKPTAKVTDEMYEQLLVAFSKSIAEKEQADQLIIGSRSLVKPVEPIVSRPVTVEIPRVEPKKEKPVEEIKRGELKAEEKPKLKVVGKIDLDPVKDIKVKKIKEDEPVVEIVLKEELIRAETPKLKGLKILGKIDKEKLEDISKKRKKSKEQKRNKEKDR